MALSSECSNFAALPPGSCQALGDISFQPGLFAEFTRDGIHHQDLRRLDVDEDPECYELDYPYR
jgi:hypothetical protein